KEGCSPNDEAHLIRLIDPNLWSVEMRPENTLVFYKGQDVTGDLYQESVGEWASMVSQLPLVREKLLEPQRNCVNRASGGLIAEGRDCGTVVFPNADLKIYLTANEEKRLLRRAAEEGGQSEELRQKQIARDNRDQNRTHAPLKKTEQSVLIDTTEMTLPEVAAKILEIARISLT
ncbi:MAG: (d)CMP kinase, partial [Bdellovibrionales bacterium]|nr:(d)CMP kinase [Bdellovibrionales bacterium]